MWPGDEAKHNHENGCFSLTHLWEDGRVLVSSYPPTHTQDMAAHLYPVLSTPPYDGSPPPEQSAGRMVKGLQSGQTNVHKVQ